MWELVHRESWAPNNWCFWTVVLEKTPESPMDCSMPGLLSIINSQSSSKPMSIELVMSSNHLFLCHPLLLLPPIPPSIRVFSNESTLHMRWPKYWSFNFSIIPSKEIPGLISFRMDWLDLLAVQGSLNSLLQHHSSNAIMTMLIKITIVTSNWATILCKGLLDTISFTLSYQLIRKILIISSW